MPKDKQQKKPQQEETLPSQESYDPKENISKSEALNPEDHYHNRKKEKQKFKANKKAEKQAIPHVTTKSKSQIADHYGSTLNSELTQPFIPTITATPLDESTAKYTKSISQKRSQTLLDMHLNYNLPQNFIRETQMILDSTAERYEIANDKRAQRHLIGATSFALAAQIYNTISYETKQELHDFNFLEKAKIQLPANLTLLVKQIGDFQTNYGKCAIHQPRKMISHFLTVAASMFDSEDAYVPDRPYFYDNKDLEPYILQSLGQVWDSHCEGKSIEILIPANDCTNDQVVEAMMNETYDPIADCIVSQVFIPKFSVLQGMNEQDRALTIAGMQQHFGPYCKIPSFTLEKLSEVDVDLIKRSIVFVNITHAKLKSIVFKGLRDYASDILEDIKVIMQVKAFVPDPYGSLAQLSVPADDRETTLPFFIPNQAIVLGYAFGFCHKVDLTPDTKIRCAFNPKVAYSERIDEYYQHVRNKPNFVRCM